MVDLPLSDHCAWKSFRLHLTPCTFWDHDFNFTCTANCGVGSHQLTGLAVSLHWCLLSAIDFDCLKILVAPDTLTASAHCGVGSQPLTGLAEFSNLHECEVFHHCSFNIYIQPFTALRGVGSQQLTGLADLPIRYHTGDFHTSFWIFTNRDTDGSSALCGVGSQQLTGLADLPSCAHILDLLDLWLRQFYIQFSAALVLAISIFTQQHDSLRVFATLLDKLALAWQSLNYFWQPSLGWLRSWNSPALSALGAWHDTQICRPGPKSRRGFASSVSSGLLFWLFLLLLLFGPWQNHWGEGCDSSMGVTEVPPTMIEMTSDGTKLHGQQPQMCDDAPKRLEAAAVKRSKGLNQVTKRSLQRAYRRSLHQGVAWYRGKMYEPEDFVRMGCRPMESPSSATDPGLSANWQRCNHKHSNRRRLNLWQWNSGGLSSSRLDEVKAWLVLNQVDLAVILETRWTFDSEWTDANWHIIHSGAGPGRGKGILLLISKQLCTPSQLYWQHHSSGILVHLRLSLTPRPLDVIACYQHTYAQGSKCLQDRSHIWTLLDTTLKGIPNRHNMVMLGDFNCSVEATTGVSGTSSFLWKSQQHHGFSHPDRARFLHILRNHALLVLNAWSSRLGPTYVHGEQSSRIDFFCVRHAYADGEAQRVRYLWGSPFLTQTEHGHVPMMCTLPRCWIPKYDMPKIQTVNMQQRQMSRDAYQNQTPAWRQFEQETLSQLSSLFSRVDLDADETIEDMHRQVMQTFCNWFPRMTCHRDPPAWLPALPTLLTKWEHRRQMRKMHPCTVSHIFLKWFHAARFAVLKRTHQRQARQIRKQRFLEVVNLAQSAAHRHDTHRLFHIINQHSPKQPKRKMQLRTQAGNMATPIECEAILNQFVMDTWHGPATNAVSFARPPGVPFSVSQLAQALALIPTTKAVAKHCGPGVIWRQHALFLAPLLHRKLQTWWQHNPPLIPSSWRHGWLFLIPKPGRPPVTPHNLRPLALQEPVGKAVAGLLIHLAMREAHSNMILFPIWAYMEHRSTLDAIRRVSLHCAEVRLLVRSQRSTPHSRAARTPRYRLYGGMQISLDLRRAFDMVDRRKLFQKLSLLNISESLISLLSTWHEHSLYFVQHDSGDCPIQVGRGVRQGCKAAPGLWNCFVVIYLHELMATLPFDWIQRHLTLYADDFHIGSTFTCLADFQYLQFALGVMLSLLKSMDMQLNPDKSVVILELRGTLARRLRQQHVCTDHHGVRFKIEVPGHENLYIPLRTSTKYLGVVISYGSFEDDSLKHRIALMNVGFARLQRWLTGKHCLTIGQRYRLWHTCIFPILSYGIFAMGLTPQGIQLVVPQLFTMLRRISHDHAYHTRRSNLDALTRHCLPTPLQLLHAGAASLLRTVTERDQFLLETDLARTITWTHLPDLMLRLEHMQATSSLETESTPSLQASQEMDFYQCNLCDFCTSYASAFRRHCTIIHGYRMYRTVYTSFADSFTDGLPTCKHCGMTFSTWRTFQMHIECGCQVLLSGPAVCSIAGQIQGGALGTLSSMQPVAADAAMRGFRLLTSDELANLHRQPFGQRLLNIVNERDWTKLALEQEACRYLSRRCILCTFQFSRCQELHQHYRTHHADLWEYAPQKAIQLTNLYSSDSPCECCGSLFSTHMCPTWSQVAVLLINGAGRDEVESTAPLDVVQRCDLCLRVFANAAELVQHLQSDHGLRGLSFNVSRDALDGNSACSHCGQVFETMSGLRTHVVQGRCLFFNPQANAETLDVDPLWKQACLDGKLLEILRPPQTRQRLTLVCQACGKRTQRSADLSLHLQTAHSRLWRRSQRLTMILVDAFYQYQCFCNPSLGIKRQNHVCLPFRQLAMSFHRLGVEPFAPTLITDQSLKEIFSDKLQRSDRYRLEQIIVHRSFSDLWQDVETLHLLSSQCIFCGARPPTADLALHLREEHPCRHDTVLFFHEQLMPLMRAANPEDFRCHLCRLVFNLPAQMNPTEPATDREAIALSHLRASCPAILQLSLLLAELLHGGSLQHGTIRLGHDRTGHGSLQRPGTDFPESRSHLETGPRSSGNQEASESRPKQARRRSRRPGDGGGRAATACAADASDAHTTGDKARPGDSKYQKNGSIHSFFEPRATGSHAGLADRNCTMEEENGLLVHSSDDATETAPHDSLAERPQEASRSGDRMPDNGSVVSDLAGQRLDSSGSLIPLSQVGWTDQPIDPGQEGSHQCQKDGAALGRASGDVHGQRIGGEISRLEGAIGAAAEDCPVAATIEPSQRSSLRAALPDGIQLDMDVGWGEHETPQSGPNLIGYGAAESEWPQQGSGQGEAQTAAFHPAEEGELGFETMAILAHGLSRLRLKNNSNWCYANSTIYGLLWTIISLQSPTDANWGVHFVELADFLRRTASHAVALADLSWFRQLLCNWGSTQNQMDCAEFSQHTLDWLCSDAFDMRWERRLQTSTGIQVLDTGSCTMPITLQFTNVLSRKSTCHLSEMFSAWCQEHAMTTALLTSPPCLIVQLDRHLQLETGDLTLCKSQVLLDAEVVVPIFRDADASTDTTGYIPVAAAAHMGQDNSGHWRTILKGQPTITQHGRPATWLMTNDDTFPEPVWMVPDWFLSGITVIWMIRTDCLMLRWIADPASWPDDTAPATTPTERSQDDLLHLLKAQTGVIHADGTATSHAETKPDGTMMDSGLSFSTD